MEGELLPSSQLEGHEFTVWSVKMTPDYNLIVSGGQDGTVRLWDIGTEKELHTMTGHNGAVYDVAVTSEGSRVVSIADTDLAVRVWDLSTGTLLTALAPNSAHVNRLAISPDNRYIVTGGNDGIARFWDFDSGVMVRELKHPCSIYSMMISRDGRHLITGSKRTPGSVSPGTIWVWDFELGVQLHELTGHDGNITALGMTADSRYILSGGQDGMVILWDLETGTKLKTMKGHTSAVLAIMVTSDDRHVLTGSGDGTIRVWLLRGGVLLQVLQHGENVHAIDFTPDGRHLATGDVEGMVQVWDFHKDSPWIDRSKERADDQDAELEAFRIVQLRKVIGRYETLPMERLAILLRFDSLAELEDWLLELPPDVPVQIDGEILVIRK